MPDGKKVFGKEINRNPELYFTDEIMAKLEIAAKTEFSYGVTPHVEIQDDNS
jgi:hypothetical protein